LNGILADDVGLGKTLETLCAVAAAHAGVADAKTLVVCPAPVAEHWRAEAECFFPGVGEIRVMSYQDVRSRIDEIEREEFVYCVLDEGHLVRNKRTAVSQAIQRLHGRYRLVLSGTPIQNGVSDLWTLMNFLMPGYLGTDEEFRATFEAKISRMFKKGASEAETEAGASALARLHQQVLPLILRRMKSDVLQELPPLVVHTLTFPMQPAQAALFGEAHVQVDGELGESAFEACAHERSLCVHPCLVRPDLPRDLESSAKLKALRELLLDLFSERNSVRNHALIFCRQRAAVAIVCNVVLRSINGLLYGMLQGGMGDADRQQVIADFQAEKLDVLVMTEQVGGVGIDLYMANAVIFVENSWNPVDDLQAMGRAHRMRTKRQVDVWNLVTQGTIEERIFEAQRRKLQIIGSIINEDNRALDRMNLDALTGPQEEETHDQGEGRLTMHQAAAAQPTLPVLDDRSDYRV
jgi:TATA-binding protein-associated factor